MMKHRFGRPKKRNLNQEKVGLFLREIGFETEMIKQEWRHLIAFGEYQGEKAVFKLASTQITSPRTRNEYWWNEAVNSTPEEYRQSFTVPRNYNCGYYGRLFYFIAQKFNGRPMLERGENVTPETEKYLPLIAKASFEIEKLPISEESDFANNTKNIGQRRATPGERLSVSTKEWASQVPLDLTAYLQIIESVKGQLRSCMGHGDFVIRQMYLTDGKIGIIDGEHAGFKGPLYYDPAYFYISLRTENSAITPAKEFLLAFRKLLKKSDQETFWDEFKPVLIQRYIGHLWGAAKDKEKLVALEPLGKDILRNKII
jgi:hypothetical protein